MVLKKKFYHYSFPFLRIAVDINTIKKHRNQDFVANSDLVNVLSACVCFDLIKYKARFVLHIAVILIL